MLFIHAEPRVVRAIDIAPVWAGHPVGFALLTEGNRQFIAFYDDQRQMTVGMRTLGSTQWRFAKLPSRLVWDSHNYIALAADAEGYLHLSGNMHVVPLVYFRSTKPWDIDSFEPLHRMTGDLESRVTYPVFFKGARNELLFTYRDGRSGSGNQVYNLFDVKTREWRRLLDRPLTDGQGRMNAYLSGPTRGPDGRFHLIWVWRNTPDCSTNHDLTYARSSDLVHWETSAGRPLELPIKVETGEIIDPIPVQGGIVNGAAHLGFDSRQRPVVSYHKFDETGYTQVYLARLEDGRWKRSVVTDWKYRWAMSGGGSIQFEIQLGAPRAGAKGELLVSFRHSKYGAGRLRIDEATLRPLGVLPSERQWPAELDQPESDFSGIQVRTHFQSGKEMNYLLRWETLGANRDRPREGPLPGPSLLRLYEIR